MDIFHHVWVFGVFFHHVWIFPAKESDPLLISEPPVRGRKEAIVQFNLCTMLMMFSGLLSKHHLPFAFSKTQLNYHKKMFAFWELTLHSMRTYFCCDKKMAHHLLQAGLCHVNTAVAHFLKVEENHLSCTGLVANGQIHYRYHHHEDWLKLTPVLNPCILPASPTLEPGCFSR